MAKPKRIIIIGATALCLAVLGMENCRSREQKETKAGESAKTGLQAEKPRAALDLGLAISHGGSGETSLIVLSLFSRNLRQAELDNVVKKEGEKLKVEPLRVSIPKKSWENVDFRILGEDESVPKESQKKLKDVALVQAPESEDVSLGPRDTLTAVYRIPSTALPLPGILVQAEMKAGKDTIQSGPIPIPDPPDSDKGILLRKAEIQLKLKSYAEAKLAAEGLIGRFPDEPAGYWIKGQALEAEGLDAEALNMYNTALEKFLAKKDDRHYEPPLPILIKIRELEEKASRSLKIRSDHG
jgi:hypothetical protein